MRILTIIFLMSLFLLDSCNVRSGYKLGEDIYNAGDFACNAEQMTKVKKDTQWCIEETAYFDSYCYVQARYDNCTNLRKPIPNQN